jgi:hypothetical protein
MMTAAAHAVQMMTVVLHQGAPHLTVEVHTVQMMTVVLHLVGGPRSLLNGHHLTVEDLCKTKSKHLMKGGRRQGGLRGE